MHIEILHNKIYNMHLESRYSEFSFHAHLKRTNKRLCNQQAAGELQFLGRFFFFWQAWPRSSGRRAFIKFIKKFPACNYKFDEDMNEPGNS